MHQRKKLLSRTKTLHVRTIRTQPIRNSNQQITTNKPIRTPRTTTRHRTHMQPTHIKRKLQKLMFINTTMHRAITQKTSPPIKQTSKTQITSKQNTNQFQRNTNHNQQKPNQHTLPNHSIPMFRRTLLHNPTQKRHKVHIHKTTRNIQTYQHHSPSANTQRHRQHQPPNHIKRNRRHRNIQAIHKTLPIRSRILRSRLKR